MKCQPPTSNFQRGYKIQISNTAGRELRTFVLGNWILSEGRLLGDGSSRSPYFPRRLAAVPQVRQKLLLAVRIHALPESGVSISGDLPFTRQSIKRLLFEHALVVGQIFANAFVHDEKAAIDETGLFFGFFLKCSHLAVSDFQIPEAARRLHGRDRDDLFLCSMKCNGVINVAVDQS